MHPRLALFIPAVLLLGGLVAVLVVTMSACSSGGKPDQAAKAWMDALFAGDGARLSELTCQAQQQAVQHDGLVLTAGALIGKRLASQFLFGATPKVSVKELTYTTVEQRGDRATVRVSGRLRVTLLLATDTQNVDERMQLVREGGRWKFCG